MKLILREYISGMRERKELDAFVPNLLYAMGLNPYSIPKHHNRQHGVDVAAVGRMPDEKKDYLYLITIKPGNATRQDWDGNPQKISPSLNEITNTYISTHIPEQYQNLPIKIVLCIGGEVEQTITLDWAQYTQNNKPRYNVEYALWCGNELALWASQYMANDQAFLEKHKKSLRRTLALIEDIDYDLSDYYQLIATILDARVLPKSKTHKKKQARKQLILAQLLVKIIVNWQGDSPENTKNLILVTERYLLSVWNYCQKTELHNLDYDCYIEMIMEAYLLLNRTLIFRHNKLQKNYLTLDGLMTRYQADWWVYHPVRVQDEAGYLAEAVLVSLQLSMVIHKEEDKKRFSKAATNIANTLIGMIEKHDVWHSPQFDSNNIEVVGVLVSLLYSGSVEHMNNMLGRLVEMITLAYAIQSPKAPIASMSDEDLLEVNFEDYTKQEYEEAIPFSTLLPILAEIAVLIGNQSAYNQIREFQIRHTKIDFQIWQPCEKTEGYLYTQQAQHESGHMMTSITLPENMDDHIKHTRKRKEYEADINGISCIKANLPLLGYVAMRHFRTEPLPFLWRGMLQVIDEINKNALGNIDCNKK